MSFFFARSFSVSPSDTLCNRSEILLFFREAALKRASLRLTARCITRIISAC